MKKVCKQCGSGFEITDEDLEFYKKVAVPQPSFCPDCRNQRRMAFRNERHLYQRKCDLCSKRFLSIYEGNTIFPVYCYDCWWSDKWDATTYSQEYNPNKAFFEQIKELFGKVPHLGIVTGYCENSDYANYTNYSKNCYLVFGCHAAENCYYGWRMHDGLKCMDCLQIDKSKYCYECVDCDECYSLQFSQDCSHCNDSAFLYDCKACSDCLFCAGLRNKSFCVFNKQLTKEEYLGEREKINLSSYEHLKKAKAKFRDFLKQYPRRSVFVLNSENSTGDHIINCKNVRFGFNIKNIHDGAYLESCEDLKDAMDSTFCGWPAELNYEGISAGCVNAYNTKFSDSSWSCTNIEYCNSCHHSKELFGCFGLRRKNEYCILNKIFDKDSYFELKEKIIEDMRKRNEYGEFFPVGLSPFSYNETIANEYYPLTKEGALKKGFEWKEPNPKDYQKQTYEIPDEINEIPNSITDELLSCNKCGKNYRVILQEVEFYRQFGLPVPRECFGCRHNTRMAQRNLRKLYDRKCSNCEADIKTTYSEDRPEKVYCEKCYLEEVY